MDEIRSKTRMRLPRFFLPVLRDTPKDAFMISGIPMSGGSR
jgi:hypothetical protein